LIKIKEKWNKLKDWTKSKWEEVKDFGENLVNNIKDFFKDIKNKIKSFFSQDFQGYIQKFSDCGGASKAKEVFGNAVSLVKGIVNKVQKIGRAAAGDMTALASIIIDIICNFDKFREGWNHFKTAWNTSDIGQKYNYYGRAFGLWLNAIATKRFNYLLNKHYKN